MKINSKIPIIGDDSFVQLLLNNDLIDNNDLYIGANFVSTVSEPYIPYGTLALYFKIKGSESDSKHFKHSVAIGNAIFPFSSAQSHFYNSRVKAAKKAGDIPELQNLHMLGMFLNSDQTLLRITTPNSLEFIEKLIQNGYFDQQKIGFDQQKIGKVIFNLFKNTDSITKEQLKNDKPELLDFIEKRILIGYNEKYQQFDLSTIDFYLKKSGKHFIIIENNQALDKNGKPIQSFSDIALLSEEDKNTYQGAGQVISFSDFIKLQQPKQESTRLKKAKP